MFEFLSIVCEFAIVVVVIIIALSGWLQVKDFFQNFMTTMYEGGIDVSTQLSNYLIGIGASLAA